jgi:alkenylglycerophosphocholine hydrolase
MDSRLVLVGLCAALSYFIALKWGTFGFQVVLKPVPIICLLIWLWPHHELYAELIKSGLVFSVIADVLLLWRRKKHICFLLGLIGFVLAHICYIGAYVSENTALQLWVTVPFILYGFIMARYMWPALGKMRWPVVIYMAVICAMMWRAATLVGLHDFTRLSSYMALAGAILFAMSDTLLAVDHFIKPIRHARYIILLLYWMAQFGIAFSVQH